MTMNDPVAAIADEHDAPTQIEKLLAMALTDKNPDIATRAGLALVKNAIRRGARLPDTISFRAQVIEAARFLNLN